MVGSIVISRHSQKEIFVSIASWDSLKQQHFLSPRLSHSIGLWYASRVTLLIVGAQDILLPSEQTAAPLWDLLPNLTTRVLLDHSHVLVNLADRVVSFLPGEKKAQLAQ